jgi:hypothetical protein
MRADETAFHFVTARLRDRHMTTLCGIDAEARIFVLTSVYLDGWSPEELCLDCRALMQKKLNAAGRRIKAHRCRACRHLQTHELRITCGTCNAKCCTHIATDKHTYTGTCPDCSTKGKTHGT